MWMAALAYGSCDAAGWYLALWPHKQPAAGA